MAALAGREALIMAGNAVVGECRGWTLNISQDTVQDTVSGETRHGHKKTMKGWDGTIDVLHDPADAGQQALPPGSVIALNLFPEPQSVPGTPDSGDQKIDGQATITGASVTTTYDGLIEASYTFLGQGALAFGTQ